MVAERRGGPQRRCRCGTGAAAGASGEWVRVCVYGWPVASQSGPELRLCGSHSANYVSAQARDLGKRESIVGSARDFRGRCAVSSGNVALRVASVKS